MRRAAVAALLLVFVGLSGLSVASRSDPLDDVINAEMAKRRIPGLAVAVLREGKVALMRSYGIANLETSSPVRTTSVFELASLTKPLTATAVMLLVQDGKVRLDDPVVKYIDQAPEDWNAITVRHLLTHTAGFEELGTPTCEGVDLMDVSRSLQLERIRTAPRLFPPGEAARYSDPGYFLLGMVIESASGLSYADFMERRIFGPLGMSSTSILDQSRIIQDRVSPYTIREDRLLRARRDWQHELPSFFGVFSSLEDLARWEQAIVEGRLLPEAALREMWSPARLNDGSLALVLGQPYGLGWQLGDYRGRRVIEHGGFTGTHILRLPEDGLTILLLSNLDNGSGNMPALVAREVAGAMNPEYLPPHMMPAAEDPDPKTTERIRGFLSRFGEPDALAMMTAEHRRIFLQQPEEVRRGMTSLFKTLESIAFLAQDDLHGRGIARLGVPVSRILHHKAQGARGFRYFSFWLTEDGQIADMRSYPY